MAKIELELEDNVYEDLKTFCADVGLPEDVLFSLFAKKVAAEKIVPFEIGKSNRQKASFDFLRSCDPKDVIKTLLTFDDYICAVVLSKIDAAKSSLVLSEFPNDRMCNIVSLIAKGVSATDDMVNSIAKYVNSVVISEANFGIEKTDGVKYAVNLLNLMQRADEKIVIETLEDKEPELAEEIKKRMFVFEDLVMLDDRSIQKVLREIDAVDVAKALKNADVEVKDKIFKNMSKRAAEMLQEDMEYMGPVRLRDVEEAQAKVVAIVRRLEDYGEIVIARCSGDMLI